MICLTDVSRMTPTTATMIRPAIADAIPKVLRGGYNTIQIRRLPVHGVDFTESYLSQALQSCKRLLTWGNFDCRRDQNSRLLFKVPRDKRALNVVDAAVLQALLETEIDEVDYDPRHPFGKEFYLHLPISYTCNFASYQEVPCEDLQVHIWVNAATKDARKLLADGTIKYPYCPTREFEKSEMAQEITHVCDALARVFQAHLVKAYNDAMPNTAPDYYGVHTH